MKMPKPQGWKGSDLRNRAEVVQWLHDHGGAVSDEQGLVIGRMREELHKGRAISQLIADMANDGMISRDVRGRRTFEVKLVDDWGLLNELVPPTPKRDNGQAEVKRAPKQRHDVDLTEVDLSDLAETLLALVLRRMADGTSPAEVEKLKAENKHLRDKNRSLEAQLRDDATELQEALRENAQLRGSIEELRNQLDKPKRGSDSIRERLTEQERKSLDRLMKIVPSNRL